MHLYNPPSSTALLSSDYTSTSGTLTIAAGTTSGTFNVPVAADTIHENDETVKITLSNASNASISDSEAILTITDDDSLGFVWTASDIATTADGAEDVYIADIDGDGDLDIVSASLNDDTIAWYENDGGSNPSFSAANIITTTYFLLVFKNSESTTPTLASKLRTTGN